MNTTTSKLFAAAASPLARGHAGRMVRASARSAVAAAVAGAVSLAAPVLAVANVLDLVRDAPDGSWLQVNQNAVSSVWTPGPLRNDASTFMGDEMNRIIFAWSSFAWDSSRSSLIIYGGGHANYGSNDVYTWNGGSLLWERSSLPSKMDLRQVGGYNYAFPIDGSLNAPTSAHTYDNTVYLSASDRYLTFGGAAFNNGNNYVKDNGNGTYSSTGPYLFNPALADANKVGGTTGSGVNPSTLGGQMWQNRDTYTTSVSTIKPLNYIDGFSDATVVNGKDVIYVGGSRGGTPMDLFRYTIHTLGDPTQDTWEVVGQNAYGLTTGDSAGALDPKRQLFVRTGDATKPLLFWDINKASASNSDLVIQPIDLTGGAAPDSFVGYGMAYDPIRELFVLWRGMGDVWSLKAPEGEVDGSGWTIDRMDVNGGATPGALDTIQVLGKWQYAADLDSFVALQGPTTGDVWIYKPEGWMDPVVAVPEPSTYALMLLGVAVVVARVRRAARVQARAVIA